MVTSQRIAELRRLLLGHTAIDAERDTERVTLLKDGLGHETSPRAAVATLCRAATAGVTPAGLALGAGWAPGAVGEGAAVQAFPGRH